MNIIKKYSKIYIKTFICIILYPVVLFFEIINQYKTIKFVEIDSSRMGNFLCIVEGYFIKKNSLKNMKLIFFFRFPICNTQIEKMSKRILDVKFNRLINYFYKVLLFWKKNDLIYRGNSFSTSVLCINKQYPGLKSIKPNIYFTNSENDKGSKLIEQFGLTNQDKWICIHNRDSSYLNKTFPKNDWSYHLYRNFSVQSFTSAANFFVSKGYYVLRMGSVVDEKFITNNDKIIDYANSKFRSDFLDVYLLANCNFFFGSDSGLGIIPLTFQKPCYGINHFYTLFHRSRWLHPWSFTFKRLKNLDTGKLLSLKEIMNLSSNFSSILGMNFFIKNKLELLDNSEEEIKSFAIEIDKEMSGNYVESKEDTKIQEEFWKIYFQYINKNEISKTLPRISPSFLRSNLDLLN